MDAKQLRNSILQMAIQGKLVPQDPNDEPASVLLDKIRQEKKRLVKEGVLKKKDLISLPILESDIPFVIPKNWTVCRVKDLLLKITDGTHHSPINTPTGDYKYITAKNIKENGVQLENITYVNKTIHDEIYTRCNPSKGDILYIKDGATTGVCCINNLDEPFSLLSSVALLKPANNLYAPYLLYCLRSPVCYDSVRESMKGTGITRITLTKIEKWLIPLPPLAEQHRIVAKLEEILPLVDEYGRAQEEADKLQAELPDKLRKSILQEAIQGKLVPQDPNDEPASVLLDKIRQEKKRLVKEGKLKKKDLVEKPISDDEKPFEIPDSWEWSRLGEIGIFERGNGIKRDETTSGGFPCIRYGEMYTKYRFAPTFKKTYSYTSMNVFNKCRKAHCGDLFMALTGENKQDIALAAQYIGKEEIAVGGDLCHFTILEAYALYFVYLINSFYFSNKKEILATGDIIVHISTDKLGSIAIPLPPLAEQHRIVTKIEELFNELNNYE